MQVAWRLELISYLGAEVAKAETPSHLARSFARRRSLVIRAAPHRLQSDRNSCALAVTENGQVNFGSRLFLPDNDLQFPSVVHLVAVDFGDHIADLKSCFGTG